MNQSTLKPRRILDLENTLLYKKAKPKMEIENSPDLRHGNYGKPKISVLSNLYYDRHLSFYTCIIYLDLRRGSSTETGNS